MNHITHCGSKVYSMYGQLGGVVQGVSSVLMVPVVNNIHENLQAIALKILFKNANPQVHLKDWGFSGGSCSWGFNIEPPIPSSLGQIFGTAHAISLATVAGPLSDAVMAVAIAKLMPKTFSVFTLLLPAMLTLQSPLFGISAILFNNKCGGDDYCLVWKNSGPIAFTALTLVSLSASLIVLKEIAKRLLNEIQFAMASQSSFKGRFRHIFLWKN